jgi:predicted DsbA family dithiol-disulfide isomerase
LAASSLEALLQEQPEDAPVELHWRSFELRPKGAPPISDEYRAQIEESRPRLYGIAKERYGIDMNPGPFGFDSRPALIGAKVADAADKGRAYNRRILNAYWEEAADIEDRDALADLAVEAGLDRDAFLAGLDDPTFINQVDHDILLARQYGLNGVPAIVFDNQFLVSGAQPLDVLRQALAQVREQENGEG